MTGYPCPADGCDVTKPTKQSIAGHYGGKRDDAHKGDFWAAMERLENAPDDHGTEAVDDAPADDPPNGPADGSGDGSADDPGGVEFPQAPEPDDNGCGHPEAYAVEAGYTYETTGGDEHETAEGDEFCPDCEAVLKADGRIHE